MYHPKSTQAKHKRNTEITDAEEALTKQTIHPSIHDNSIYDIGDHGPPPKSPPSIMVITM